ncbi:MAG: hypothetical protein K9L17_05530 [Clostridiales bacterium]|nr:hypothetical protein [Clostridiales bacterium]MCF8022132.1 hypothetical protein [Clostridiales bacterium]
MKKQEIIHQILSSNICKEWHWFKYHFDFYKSGLEHPFARAIIEALYNIELRINGVAKVLIDRIASINGKEKYLPHYEQLLQICSEIYVLNQAVNYFTQQEVEFLYEPSLGVSNKNPEFIIKNNNYSVGIEVKQPSLINHMQQRNQNPYQIATRAMGKKDIFQGGKVTLPRDNPVKDFLISADEKFSSFKKTNNFFGVLFIIWDDFIYEPISALIGKPYGLFLEGSFAKDKNGHKLDFENVDAVFIDRQLTQFLNAAADRPLLYGKSHAMDYGSEKDFPFKVKLQNPRGSDIPREIMNCYHIVDWAPELGAEYNPNDFIFWF